MQRNQKYLRRRSPSDVLSTDVSSPRTNASKTLRRSSTAEELENQANVSADCNNLDLFNENTETHSKLGSVTSHDTTEAKLKLSYGKNEQLTSSGRKGLSLEIQGIDQQHSDQQSYHSNASSSNSSSSSRFTDMLTSLICKKKEENDAVLRKINSTEDVLATLSIEEDDDDGDDDDLDDLQRYRAKRVMTPLQEKWNALTMIPNPLFCIYFITSAWWLPTDFIQQARNDYNQQTELSLTNNNEVNESLQCWDSATWHSMPSMPPLAVMAVALGICLHAPFSFLYHWSYACRPDALQHWSRRMDHTMIHTASALMSYGTSGSLNYFLVNCAYNADCIYKQLFDRNVQPRRNQLRVFVSIIAYTIPVLKRGDLYRFGQICIVVGISGWLFAAYPVGGWSHALFHLVISALPPLLMMAACDLPVSQEYLTTAANCIIQNA